MKPISLKPALLVALVAALSLNAGCKKTSKGKMANEWTVSSIANPEEESLDGEATATSGSATPEVVSAPTGEVSGMKSGGLSNGGLFAAGVGVLLAAGLVAVIASNDGSDSTTSTK